MLCKTSSYSFLKIKLLNRLHSKTKTNGPQISLTKVLYSELCNKYKLDGGLRPPAKTFFCHKKSPKNLKISKMSKNPKIGKFFQKSPFFKKIAILLVLPFKEISIQNPGGGTLSVTAEDEVRSPNGNPRV